MVDLYHQLSGNTNYTKISQELQFLFNFDLTHHFFHDVRDIFREYFIPTAIVTLIFYVRTLIFVFMMRSIILLHHT